MQIGGHKECRFCDDYEKRTNSPSPLRESKPLKQNDTLQYSNFSPSPPRNENMQTSQASSQGFQSSSQNLYKSSQRGGSPNRLHGAHCKYCDDDEKRESSPLKQGSNQQTCRYCSRSLDSEGPPPMQSTY